MLERRVCVCVCVQRDEAAELRGQLASSEALVHELRASVLSLTQQLEEQHVAALMFTPPRAAAIAASEPPAADENTQPENTQPVGTKRAPRPSKATAASSPRRRVPASTTASPSATPRRAGARPPHAPLLASACV